MADDERNYFTNGRFLHDLTDWDADGGAVYAASDGDDHYGMAVLPVGGSIAQDITVEGVRSFSLHYALKCTSNISAGQVTIAIVDSNGNTVTTLQPTYTASSWSETTSTLGLADGTVYTVTITNVSAGASVKVDDVWLWYVPQTRAQLAAQVHSKLGRLASERSYSTASSGSNTEGDYTNAVSAGLRTVGAIDDDTGEPDVRYLDAQTVDAALEAIEIEMLEKLQRDYAVETDISVGGRSESRSQIASLLGALTGSTAGQSGPRRVQVRTLYHAADDLYGL